MPQRRFSKQLRFLSAVVHAHETLAEHTRALNDLLRMMVDRAQEAELFASMTTSVTAPPPPTRADDSDPPTNFAEVDTLSHSLAIPPHLPQTRSIPRFTPGVFRNYVLTMWAEASTDEDRAEVRVLVTRGVTSGLLTLNDADELLGQLAQKEA